MYPRIVIDLKKFKHNVETMLDLCHQNMHSMMAVSKVFCAEEPLIDILNETQVEYIADSRVQNLKKIRTTKPKVLLRLPQLSELDDVVQYSDMSLNSEKETLIALNQSAKKYNKIHGILLMLDLGDLREGVFDPEERLELIKYIETMSHLNLLGIGTNLTCYGGVIPTEKTLEKLIQFKEEAEKAINKPLPIISGGNSSNIALLQQRRIPKGINNVRLGESIVLGRETAYGNPIQDMYDDVFLLEASVIENKIKPSVPIGTLGMNAFGETVSFKEKGLLKRAILAIGKQDVNHRDLIPVDSVVVLGSSSDHLILDVSNAKKTYAIGDTITFKLTYGSVLSLMTSPYVEKVYV
jgi:predicted amino acid racemase